MANTEDLATQVIRLPTLQPEDLAMLNTLVDESRWNQTSHDWQTFSQLGSIHVIRNDQGRILASGAVLPYQGGVAWISMILVTPASRGQGLGRTVFEHCLKEVEAANHTAMLDATPDGERLYSQYAFSSLWGITRWHRPAAPPIDTHALQHPATRHTDIANLDSRALGFARHALLADLAGRKDTHAVREAQAVAIVRTGRVARHIGPLLASDEPTAARLLDKIACHTPEPLLIDVPDDRPIMRTHLEAAGFTPQRGFVRMARGRTTPQGMTAFIHAIAGPEFG